ncbi:uncharacterized protein LOC134815955 isoform X1 [Bolinopsis microptera]|uniref:uncharacterized protein LOC134815955 isoform X1 n=1 Tax=Bolinopsis microptera TaxID=2820187 RepID=UPI00307AAD92
MSRHRRELQNVATQVSSSLVARQRNGISEDSAMMRSELIDCTIRCCRNFILRKNGLNVKQNQICITDDHRKRVKMVYLNYLLSMLDFGRKRSINTKLTNIRLMTDPPSAKLYSDVYSAISLQRGKPKFELVIEVIERCLAYVTGKQTANMDKDRDDIHPNKIIPDQPINDFKRLYVTNKQTTDMDKDDIRSDNIMPYLLKHCQKNYLMDLSNSISRALMKKRSKTEKVTPFYGILWNDEISLCFQRLLQPLYCGIPGIYSTIHQLNKFIDLLMTKKQLWPVGTMTAAFLKIKASEWLEVIKSNPTAANVLHDFQTPEFTKQELSRVKYYTDLDTPQNTKSPEDDVRFDTFPKKLSPNIAVGSDDTNSCKTTVDQPRTSFPHIHTSRLELHGPRSSTTRISRHRSDDSVVGSESKDHEYEPHCSSSRKGLFRHRSEESYVKGHDHHKNQYSESPNSRSVCSRKTSSRHRSDESLADQKSASVKSPQRKRYSNEYLSEQHRSTKRPKLDDRFFVKKMTDYDQKLQSFQIWDPLRNVTEAKFQDIFKTKEETVINNEQASVGTSSVTLDSNKTLDECEEKGLINIEDIPLPKEDVSTSGIDQKPKISDNNEQQFKCKLGEIVNLCGLTEKKGGHLRLQERYGEMKVKTEELGAERVSVIVTIQGYTFEGIATSRENAVEEASNKALLLAPFILQQTSNLLSEET